jgi:hypothetical protein
VGIVTRVFEIAKCGLHIIIGPGVHLHHNTCCYRSEDRQGITSRDEYFKVYAIDIFCMCTDGLQAH